MTRLAILGCGDVATRTYIPGLLASERTANVVAVCDPIPERAQAAAASFPGSVALTSLAELTARDDIDGVINLTPAPMHRETTQALLAAGFHVLSEKPLGATVEDGRALIAYASEVGKLLLCAPAVMTTPRVAWMREMINRGRIGRLTHAFGRLATMGPAGWDEYTGDPAAFYAPGVGPAVDLGVYLITTITGLFGPAKRVQAMGGILIPERSVTIPRLTGQTITVKAPDLISMHLDFGNTTFATIISSFVMPSNRGPVLEIMGEQGVMAVTTETDYWSRQSVDLFHRDAAAPGTDEWTVAGPDVDEPLLVSGPRHFVDCIEGRAEPVMTAEHALHVLDVMTAAERSIASGDSETIRTTFSLPNM